MMPPLAHAAEHVAAVIEQAGDAGALDAFEIIPHRALAFRREQFGEIALHQFGAVIAEQRFGAAVARIDVALGVEHHDAFGRGVEDGAEFLGIGVADGRRLGGSGRHGFARIAAAISALSAPRREKISASAESSSHEIVYRCASVADGGACSGRSLASPEIVTGVPVSEVLLAVDTPGST